MIPKSEKDAHVIGHAIKSNFLFQHLTREQRSSVIGIMLPVPVKAGDWIIRQGEDREYIHVW
jgi:CRP-like cAMP-binding protein